MGLAVDTVVGTAANPGTTFTALSMVSGDSLTVRNFGQGDYAELVQMIRQGATSGQFRLRSPLLHDDVQGIRTFESDTPLRRALPRQIRQRLRPQDALIAELTGGTAETDLGALQFFYNNLPGASARLHHVGDIVGNVEGLHGVLTTCTTAGTAGVWADRAINADQDVFKANRDYAILGYLVDAACAVVAYRGSDTGNLRIGGPGTVDPLITNEFFVQMEDQTGLPFIPVFNSANKGAFQVSVSSTATGATVNVTTLLALLSNNLPS